MLASRYLAHCVPFVSRLRLASRYAASCPRQGSWSAGTPALPALSNKETVGSPEFPSCPFGHMPRSTTPVVSSRLAIASPGLLPSAPHHVVGFPSYYSLQRLSSRTTTTKISGLHHAACVLATSGFVPPITETHAVSLPTCWLSFGQVRLWLLPALTHWATMTSFMGFLPVPMPRIYLGTRCGSFRTSHLSQIMVFLSES